MMRLDPKITMGIQRIYRYAVRLWESKYITQTLNLGFALCLALLVTRVYTYWLTGVYDVPLLSILRGIGSDFLFGTLIASLLTLLPFLWMRYFLSSVFLYLIAGNVEHVITNGANLSYIESYELLETQFLFGSGLSEAIFLKFVLLLASFFVGIVANSYGSTPLRKKIMAIFIACSLLPSGTLMDSDWYEYNLIESNIAIFSFMMSHRHAPKSAVTLKQIQDIYHVDMDGERFTHSPVSKPNILIITIEALSPEYMRRGWVPLLKKRIKDSLYYDNYMPPTRITVNGHYSMLCGDYPGLDSRLHDNNSDKIDKVIRRNKPVMCLPRIMRSEGYDTYYIQATNTDYRNERRFMKLLGFQNIMDDTNFPIRGQTNADWGPIDSVVFKNAMQQISQVSQANKPWFMMIMTEGTHDPFTVPKDCTAKLPKSWSEENTYRCMDEALDNFLNWLDVNHIRDNTLVMVTADESIINGRDNKQWVPHLLDNNHGILMVLTPDKVVARKTDFFMQPDLLASILDYIDTPEPLSEHDFGRSIFRDYSRFRPLYFSMVYLNIFHMMPDANHLISSYRTENKYRKYYLPQGKLFDGEYESLPVSQPEKTNTWDLSSIIENHLPRTVKNEPVPQTKQ